MSIENRLIYYAQTDYLNGVTANVIKLSQRDSCQPTAYLPKRRVT